MPEDPIDRPFLPEEMLCLHNICPAEDGPAYGHSTPSSRSFWLDDNHDVQIMESSLVPGAFELRTESVVNLGLPLQDIAEEPTRGRSGERFGEFLALEGHVPDGLGVAYHPTIAQRVPRTVGRTASGRRTLLAEDPHVTIFNGESRESVYPREYPYTAVCKVETDSQAAAGAPWGNVRHASGFLVGRRTLMTSGHLHPDPAAYRTRMKVIPACWAGRSVLGLNYFTWAKSAHWWYSDSGNDLMAVELQDPIGDRAGTFDVMSYRSQWQDKAYWLMCGFPYDQSIWAPSLQRSITVRDDDDGDDVKVQGKWYDTTQIESDADEASGASGSPLFAIMQKSRRAVAIGVHHGTETDTVGFGSEKWSCAAGGAGFVKIVEWAKAAWG